jgi:tetratricopeptide (TPR) repeat protein
LPHHVAERYEQAKSKFNPKLKVVLKMKNTYFTSKEFNKNWGFEVSESMNLYENILGNLPEYGMLHFDFTYKSDKRDKIEALANILKSKYHVTNTVIKKKWWKYELNGYTPKFPLTKDNIIYWQIAFNEEGYLFDCKLSGYGSLTDPKNIKFLDYSSEKEDYYYEKGLNEYEIDNLWGAMVNWNNCIKVNPKSYISYRDIGYLKEELHMPFEAMESYEKAIEIKTNFRSALVNLGALKDKFEEYEEAIKYYDKAIKVAPKDPQAYFNKGNTMFNLKRTKEACKLWQKAKKLGGDYAQKRIDKECKKACS